MGWRSINRFTKTSYTKMWLEFHSILYYPFSVQLYYLQWEQIKFHLQDIHDHSSLNVQLLQKEIFETFSKSLPSSNNLETLAEQLADQLSVLDPRGWFQSLTHSIGSGAIMLIIILGIIFVEYWCLSTNIVQTKQTQLVRACFTKSIYSHPLLWKNKKGGIVRERSTFRDQICGIFFLCIPFLKDSLFFMSSWNTGMSRAACNSRDWDHGKEHLLGFPSVTPFSDLLLTGLSILLQLMEFHS